jgi:acetamidase/formamidase
MTRFRLDGHRPENQQLRWSATRPAVLTVPPGSIVEVTLPDSSTDQLSAASTRTDLAAVDFDRMDAAIGPIAVEGARAGDTLRVEVRSIRVGVWGWSGVFRKFGLLQDRFDDDLVIWDVKPGVASPRSGFLRPVRVPLHPMIGWVGVAPGEGELGLIAPQRFGGNLDNRFVGAGTSLELPVQQEGALVSLGDPHAAQGDGEVCGTGIEVPARVTVRLELVPGRAPAAPRATVPRRSPESSGTCWVTMGVAPDLHDASQEAVEQMISWLEEVGWTAAEAYLLLSVAGHLRISEIVDRPNFVVSMVAPRSVFDLGRRRAPGRGPLDASPRQGQSSPGRRPRRPA